MSKKYGYNINLLGLNPRLTSYERKQRERGIKGEKLRAKIIKELKRQIHKGKHYMGKADIQRKEIYVEQRLAKRLQHRVIKHEIEHIKHGVSEKKIGKITFKKYGWKSPQKGYKGPFFRK